MKKDDIVNKINRGIFLALIESKDITGAILLYRQYLNYLVQNKLEDEAKRTKNAFKDKLLDFIDKNKNNKKEIPNILTAYQALITEYPDNVCYLKDCTKYFMMLNQYDIALEIMLQAEKIAPEDTDIKKYLCDLYFENGFGNDEKIMTKVIEYNDFIVKKEPNYLSYINMSKAYGLLYDINGNKSNIENAVKYGEMANKLEPNNKMILLKLAEHYAEAKDYSKLNDIWNQILKLKNLDHEAYTLYAHYLLRTGRLKEGFKYYENRIYGIKDLDKGKVVRKYYKDSTNLKNKKVLLLNDQGYGDLFLFARYIKKLKDITSDITIGINDNVSTLLKRNFPDIKFFGAVSPINPPDDLKYDTYIYIVSLFHALNLDMNDVRMKEKYLFADVDKVKKFKEELFNNNKFKIGILTQGSKGILTLKTRNIEIEKLKPLFNLDKVQCYALEYGKEDKDYENLNIINLAKYINDFDDTAAIIENMDLIVCTDNNVMNLAGAMDKMTFTLFNDVPEYRWFDLTGDDVVWYNSVKPYQCKNRNEWEPVIDRMVNDIKELIK